MRSMVVLDSNETATTLMKAFSQFIDVRSLPKFIGTEEGIFAFLKNLSIIKRSNYSLEIRKCSAVVWQLAS